MNPETAKQMLAQWIMAEQSVMIGQEYTIGTRKLRRADLDMIAERVKYWTKEVGRYEGRPRNRVQQAIFRDS